MKTNHNARAGTARFREFREFRDSGDSREQTLAEFELACETDGEAQKLRHVHGPPKELIESFVVNVVEYVVLSRC